MNANEILQALSLPGFTNYKNHCNKLAVLYSFLKQSKIVKVGFTGRNIDLTIGQETERKYKNNEWETKVIYEGEIKKGNKIKITTETGNYSFAVPIENDFYTAICDLLGLPCVPVSKPEIKALKSIVIESKVIEAIRKAAKFTSKDTLRPSFQTVCLHFEDNRCEVVGTDAHYVYLSRLFKCSKTGKEPFNLLIHQDSIKRIAAIKTKEDTINIEWLPDNIITIAGIEINVCDERYPNYKAVIEEYSTKMVFDKDRFINAVKVCEPYANKSTKQVNFHLNGKIELHSEDIDFSYEINSELPYISKDFPDMDIAFNGEMVRNCVSIFKEKEISMYSAGKGNRMAIFTNGIERACIMPLMLNN